MNGIRFGLALPLSCAAFVAMAGTAGAQDLVFTEAERTPLGCDVEFSVTDLTEFTPPAAATPYTIAVSVPSFANPYIQALVYGAELAAEEAGVTLTVGAGRGFMDPASQITQFENALARRPDAILINPADPAGLATAIDDAVAAGVPVVEVGTLSISEVSTKVVQDDYMQGVRAAEALADLMPDGGEGILMGGPANASWSRRRVAGFLDQVTATPDIQVNAVVNTDIDPQQALTRLTNTAQAHPNVDWIYAVGSFLLAPQSIPPEYADATYLGGTLTTVSLDALANETANAILPDFPVAVGYVGVSLAVSQLNGDTVPQRNCIPNAVMTAGDLDNPVWVDSSIVPEDWVAPQ